MRSGGMFQFVGEMIIVFLEKLRERIIKDECLMP